MENLLVSHDGTLPHVNVELSDWTRRPIASDHVPTLEETAEFLAHWHRREYQAGKVRCVGCLRFFPTSIDIDPSGMVLCSKDRRDSEAFLRSSGLR